MKIRCVHIKNLNSLRGEWTIDFSDPPLSQTGIFAITGPTGAGKTTVLDAITLALYGSLARSKDVKEVLSYGTTECQAGVEFEVGSDRYLASWLLYRARGKQDGNLIGPKREVSRWNAERNSYEIIAEKIREVEEAVETITSLDYHRFTRSVLLSQGDFAAFLKADERERSDLLERITGTEIYSEISKASFARTKAEQQKLDGLQEQLKNLGLLEEEAVDPEILNVLRKQTAAAQQKMDAGRKELQAAERYQEALSQLKELERHAQQLAEQEKAFAPQQIRLTASQALRPYATQLDEWQRIQKNIPHLQADINELTTKGQNTRAALDKQAANQEHAQATLQAVRMQTATRREELQQAALLSQERDALSQLQAERIEATEKARTDCAAWTTALEDTQTQREQARDKLAELDRWLADQSAAAELESRLPAIEEQRERLAEIYRERNKLQEEQARLAEALTHQQTEVEKLDQHLGEQQQKATTQLESLRQALPDRFDLSRTEAVDRLRTEIRQLENRAHQLNQLMELDEQYRQLLREQTEYESRLAELLTDQQQLSKAILNKVEEQDLYQKTLAFKRQVYQQQQLIANYTKDRQQLETGEPCPLCGSTEHPYHEETLTPFIDAALAEFEAAQAHYEKLQRDERKLLQRENEIAQEIAMLQGQDLEQLSGRLAQQQARMETFEAKIAGLLQGEEDWSQEARGGLLAQRHDKLQKQLQQWQSAEQQVQTVNSELQALVETKQALEKDLSAARARLEAREAEAKRVQNQLEETEQRYSQAIQRLDEQLEPLGHRFDLKTAKQVFTDLRTRSKTYQEKQALQAEISKQLHILSSKAEQLTPQLERRRKELAAQEAQLEKGASQLQQLNAQLQQILGEDSLETLQAAAEELLHAAEEAVKVADTQWHQLNSELASNTQRLSDREGSLQVAKKEAEKLKRALLPALEKLGYTTLAEAEAYRLIPTEEQQLEKEAQDLRLALAENASAQRSAEVQRDKWSGAAEKEVASLKNELAELEATYQQLLRQLGQLEEKQAQAEKRAAQHAELLETIDKQRQEFNRWAQLNELIGQADGKKFRTFAQGLTLQKLVALANQHLERLNGRYLIHKRPDADLELDIVDTFQADNRRSMYTLSGGESFLVSLALALGLSDLAGKHAQIHSLFIDEGFGTLDEHSLDLALDTLENLQSSGKTIGVISHVKALKERISVQVQIEKGSNGFSKLRVV